MAAPDVRFCGEVRPGTRSPNVIGYKHALARAGYMKWPTGHHHFTDYCGANMARAIVRYKKDHKLDNVAVIGPIMHERLERTHAKVKRKEWAFDSFSISLMAAYYKSIHISPDVKIRRAIIEAARYWYIHRDQIVYSQSRPMIMAKPPTIIYKMDCSWYATTCHYAGGAPDPNRRGYDHQGYTGTLIHGGRRCSYSELKPGDLIFYGYTYRSSPAFNYGDPTHVAVFEGHQTDAVYSMGSSVGPSHYSAHYRSVNCYVTYDVTP